MIVQNTANGKMTEYGRFDDILENNIRPTKLNATGLEIHLARINKGTQRRLRNNHAKRLAKYKATI